MFLHFFNVCFQRVKLQKHSPLEDSYVFQDGLGLLLAKWLCQSVSNSEGAFSLTLDETTQSARETNESPSSFLG